ALSALVNLEVAPRCRVAYKGLIDSLRVGFLNAQIPEGRVVKDFPGYIFYVGKNRNGNLVDVIVYSAANKTTVHATRGRMDVDMTNQLINLHLYDAKSLTEGHPGTLGATTLQIPIPPLDKGSQRPKITDMT